MILPKFQAKAPGITFQIIQSVVIKKKMKMLLKNKIAHSMAFKNSQMSKFFSTKLTLKACFFTAWEKLMTQLTAIETVY